jgi:hypothetical protein
MMKQQIPQGVVITGILCLTALEMVALMTGLNGVLFTTVVAAVALAIGVTLPQFKLK